MFYSFFLLFIFFCFLSFCFIVLLFFCNLFVNFFSFSLVLLQHNVYLDLESWQCRGRGVAAGRGRGDADASRLFLHAGDGCNNLIAGVRV